MIGSSTTAYGYEKVLASGANQASALTSFHDLGANADSKENASQLIETQMVSFFGRLNYKFNERYLFQASLRADGSSVLAKGHSGGISRQHPLRGVFQKKALWLIKIFLVI